MTIRNKAKKLSKWIKKAEEVIQPSELPKHEDLLDQFIHYLLFYASDAKAAREAFEALKDKNEYGGWNEVRVATVNEICKSLNPKKVEHAGWLARRLRGFLEGTWRILNEMSFDKVKAEKITKAKEILTQIEDKSKQMLFGEHEERRGEEPVAEVLPYWAPTYILTAAGIDSQLPWDPRTERMVELLKLYEPGANLVRKKKQVRALVKSDEEALHLHHLFVELGKKLGTDSSENGKGLTPEESELLKPLMEQK